jgi:hypothetical protein
LTAAEKALKLKSRNMLISEQQQQEQKSSQAKNQISFKNQGIKTLKLA